MTFSSSSLRAPFAVALLAGALSVLPLAGCTDDGIEGRVAAQETIQQVAQQFELTMASHSVSDLDATIKALRSLQGQIDSLGSVSDEQRMAASLLGASVAQATAQLEFAKAIDLSTALQEDRIYAAAAADAAAMLQSIADTKKKMSLASNRTFLTEARTEADKSLKSVQESLRQLEGPINEFKARVAERKGEIAALQANADDLRRRASEAGDLAGFPLVEQAADVKGKIRDARSSAANDELELTRLEPEQNRANLAHDGAKSIVSAATAGLNELENFQTALNAEADQNAKAADEYRAKVEAKLAEIATREGQLKELFGAVETSLNKASNAGSAAGRGSRSVAENAKQTKLAAMTALARLYVEQASDSTSSMQLHAALAAAGDLFGGSAKQESSIKALTAARTESLEKAKAQVVDAIGHLGESAENDASALKGIRQSLNGMLASIDSQLPAQASGAAGAAPTGTGDNAGEAAPANDPPATN